METQINYFHICDMAFVSDGGKANIIGIFKNIYNDTFPFTHLKFTIIGSFIVKNGKGKNKQIIKLLDKNTQHVYKEVSFDINIQENEQEINFIWDLENIVFNKPGDFFVKLLLTDKEIASLPLSVIKR